MKPENFKLDNKELIIQIDEERSAIQLSDVRDEFPSSDEDQRCEAERTFDSINMKLK